MRELLNRSGTLHQRLTGRRSVASLSAALFALLGVAVSAHAEEFAQAQTSGAFASRAYDKEIADMRFGFSRQQPPPSRIDTRTKAKLVKAYLPDTGASFRAHYAFSAEAAAEQLESAEQKATDELTQLQRRARVAITARPANQRLVRKSSWLNTLGLDRRTVDKRELVAKLDELHRGTPREIDQVEEMLGDIEADGFLYSVARASHRLVISAERSISKLYSDYVAPKNAYADEAESEIVNGSRPILSYERDGISRF